jgi:hypothetical protein
MPSAVFLAEQDPPISNARRGPGKDCSAETEQGLNPADRSAVAVGHADFPGAHAEGLAAMSPKPAKEKKSDEYQISRENPLIRCERYPPIEGQCTRGRRKQHPAQHETVIKDGPKPSPKTWKRALPGKRSLLASLRAAGCELGQGKIYTGVVIGPGDFRSVWLQNDYFLNEKSSSFCPKYIDSATRAPSIISEKNAGGLCNVRMMKSTTNKLVNNGVEINWFSIGLKFIFLEASYTMWVNN